MGELCHTKRNLRLPLSSSMEENFVPKAEVIIEVSDGEVTDDKKHNEDEQNEHNLIESDEDKSSSELHILPTPSCLGSMDSLSGSSSANSSDRPNTFLTFGKNNKSHNDDSLKDTSIVFIDDNIESQKNDKNLQNKENTKYYVRNKHVMSLTSSARLSDSTDEDSGKHFKFVLFNLNPTEFFIFLFCRI